MKGSIFLAPTGGSFLQGFDCFCFSRLVRAEFMWFGVLELGVWDSGFDFAEWFLVGIFDLSLLPKP